MMMMKFLPSALNMIVAFLSEYFFVFTEYHNGLRFLFYETNIKKMKRVYDQNKNKYLLMESP